MGPWKTSFSLETMIFSFYLKFLQLIFFKQETIYTILFWLTIPPSYCQNPTQKILQSCFSKGTPKEELFFSEVILVVFFFSPLQKETTARGQSCQVSGCLEWYFFLKETRWLFKKKYMFNSIYKYIYIYSIQKKTDLFKIDPFGVSGFHKVPCGISGISPFSGWSFGSLHKLPEDPSVSYYNKAKYPFVLRKKIFIFSGKYMKNIFISFCLCFFSAGSHVVVDHWSIFPEYFRIKTSDLRAQQKMTLC